MARIAGIDLPKDKRIEIGLTYIYGIGRKSAKDILEKAGVNPDTRVKDLTDAEEQKLRDAIDAEARLYDRLFDVENPAAETERDFREMLNPNSLEVRAIKVEPYVKEIATQGAKLQFQRIGYFTPDLDSTPERLVFNRTIGLRDSWEKEQKKA